MAANLCERLHQKIVGASLVKSFPPVHFRLTAAHLLQTQQVTESGIEVRM